MPNFINFENLMKETNLNVLEWSYINENLTTSYTFNIENIYSFCYVEKIRNTPYGNVDRHFNWERGGIVFLTLCQKKALKIYLNFLGERVKPSVTYLDTPFKCKADGRNIAIL